MFQGKGKGRRRPMQLVLMSEGNGEEQQSQLTAIDDGGRGNASESLQQS